MKGITKMDENQTVVYINEVPTVKDQVIGAAIGIGVTIVTYGVIIGAVTGYAKVQNFREKRAEKKLALFEETPEN